MMSGRGGFPYHPDSQESIRYGVTPFQRFEINLGLIDRSQGQFFPEIEGESLYVERADYPALLSIITNDTNVGRTIPVREGMYLKAPFKGVWITHPALFGVQPNNGIISLLVGKSGANFENTLNTPFTRLSPPYRVVGGGAAEDVIFFLPPGCRCVEAFSVQITATTMTRATVGFLDKSGTVLNGPSSITGYISTNTQLYPLLPQAITGGFILQFQGPLMIPATAVEMDLSMAGTGVGGVIGSNMAIS